MKRALACLLLAACTPGPGATDAGRDDAGVADAGPADAGSFDAGLDAGRDAGVDAGVDAGADAGCGWTVPDAGVSGGCPSGSPGPTGQPYALIPLDAGTVVHANLTYGTRGGRVLQGDLWLPAPGGAPKGILVMVHGGGWLDCGQRRDVIGPFGAFFMATQNVAVFNIEYRLIQEGGQYPNNLSDVKCAVQYITAHAQDYGLDAAKVAILGESAGAHLALMTALTQDRADLDPGCSAQPPRVKAVIAYSPPTDLPLLAASASPARGAPGLYTQSTCSTPVTGCASSCDRCLDASPRAHACTPPPAKVTIVHAPDPYDGLLSDAQARALYATLADAGAQVKLVIPDAGAVAAQTWLGMPCTADAGLAHGFQSSCLLTPTYSDLAAAVQDALGP